MYDPSNIPGWAKDLRSTIQWNLSTWVLSVATAFIYSKIIALKFPMKFEFGFRVARIST